MRVEKKFSLYTQTKDVHLPSTELLMEISDNHFFTCLFNKKNKEIFGLELFHFTHIHKDWRATIMACIGTTHFVESVYASYAIFLNFPAFIATPVALSHNLNAPYLLDNFFPTTYSHTYQADDLSKELGMKIYSKINKDIFEVFTENFSTSISEILFHHSLHPLLLNDFKLHSIKEANLINLKIYNNYCLICVVRDAVIQLIQYFPLRSHWDITYLLLDIAKQLNLDKTKFSVYVSGNILKGDKAMQWIASEFKDIVFQNPLLHYTGQLKGYNILPHFLTPYLDLIV